MNFSQIHTRKLGCYALRIDLTILMQLLYDYTIKLVWYALRIESFDAIIVWMWFILKPEWHALRIDQNVQLFFGKLVSVSAVCV